MIAASSEILHVAMSDGVELAMRVYGAGAEPRPVLFAASAYRFDNDDIPETCTFLWRETGPIDWYVEQGYAYVHLDVRGSGRSGGSYAFFDARERRDLYEAIEWVAAQPWCTGKVGGIGHSYYATTQWCMASENPPHLACIAPYDGHLDLYRGWAYHGGIPCQFLTEWWCNNVRPINLRPLTADAPPRDIELDLPRAISLHPLEDAFWRERSFADKLDGCRIPVYSIGAWCKLDLHLAGNIEGYRRMAGPKTLFITAAPHMSAVQAEFESVAFHEQRLLPFYDHYLKGLDTGFERQPAVSYQVRNAGQVDAPGVWPPQQGVSPIRLRLQSGPSGTVRSLNDGRLALGAADGESVTSYAYPDHEWSLGNICFTPTGPDAVCRNLTFTSPPLREAVDLVGEAELTLWLASSRNDADVILKLVEQWPLAPEQAARGVQPRSTMVAKGWLRASHRRVLDREHGLRHVHSETEPLVAGEVCELAIGLTPAAYRFSAGSRIRLDVSCADSPVTDAVFAHSYTPDKVGVDTLHHCAERPSHLTLPLTVGPGELFGAP